MKILFLINDAPYGTEKAFNAFRLANQVKKDSPESEVRIFLMADAVFCAIPNQKTPDGYYNIERFIKGLAAKGCPVKLCGTCLDARGLTEVSLINGAVRSNLAELSEWVITSDKVLTF
ncbi:MAG: DsrE/DsrF/TusD sulfur relay family protein [Tenuifilaceae bacterium]